LKNTDIIAVPREPGDRRLKANVIGPWGLAALAIGITSPAMGLYALWGPMQAAAGPVAPLIFLAALAVTLPTALSYAGLNRHAPSAGSAAAWLWITAGPSAGFLAGLIMMTYFVMTSISQPLLFSLFFRDLLELLHIHVPGRGALVVGILIQTGLIAWICLRGAEASIRTTVRLMLAETAVVLALSATILVVKASQPGGINLGPFNPLHATHGVAGVWTAMILGVMAFCGFDVVSTAAEESHAPREHVPRAILFTVVGIGLFWAINVWALTLSTPDAKVVEYNSHGLTAITPVAEAYWGGGGFIVILTAFTGLTAVYISCVQGASRIIFALARHHLLPAPLARLHGEKRIPRNAIIAVVAACILFDLASLYIFRTGLDGFVWWSNALVFFATLTFAGVNLANFLYFRRVIPDQFRVVRNVVVPALGVGINLYLIYAAFFSALWSGPFLTGKSVVIGCVALLIAQLAVVVLVRFTRPGLLASGAPIGADPG
jgi:putrescine importer